MDESVTLAAPSSGDPGDEGGGLRSLVLAGPAAPVGAQPGDARLARAAVAGITATDAVAALGQADHRDAYDSRLSGLVTLVLVLGLCLACGSGYDIVIARWWPLLASFAPRTALFAPVTGAALSQARGRLGTRPLRAYFAVGAMRAYTVAASAPEALLFGLLAVAVDGTVLDAVTSDENVKAFTVPSGGRFPQVRVVTIVACATRAVLAAAIEGCAVSEQVLWDRLVASLHPGMILLADRNLCATRRLVTFPAQLGGTGGMFLGPWLTRTRKGMGTVACQ